MPRIQIEITDDQLAALETVFQEAGESLANWSASADEERETRENTVRNFGIAETWMSHLSAVYQLENDHLHAPDMLMADADHIDADQAPLAACANCGGFELLYWEQVGARRDVLRIETREDEGKTILIQGQIDTYDLEGDDPEAYIVCDECQSEVRLDVLIKQHGYSVDWV